MSDFIGPALPPHLLKKREEKVDSSDVEGNEEQCVEDSFIGPALPPRSASQEKDVKESDEDNSILELHAEISDEEFRDDCAEESKDVYGPALPPSLNSGQSSKTVGPQLPPGHKFNDSNYSMKDSNLIQEEKVSRLSSNHAQDSGSEEEVIGPLPAVESTDAIEYLQAQLDQRAMKMKRKLAGEEEDVSGTPKRESWMLELPPDRAEAFGLGPRQFRARAKPDAGDRSVWTDTPADRAKKHTSQAEVHRDQSKLEMKAVSERDEAMQLLVEKHNKKKRKKESLLEMHQKELKKKKKKDKEAGKHEERRPFSREIDLQTNRFDEAQKKSILKKAQLLNDRFSSGQSKFL